MRNNFDVNDIVNKYNPIRKQVILHPGDPIYDRMLSDRGLKNCVIEKCSAKEKRSLKAFQRDIDKLNRNYENVYNSDVRKRDELIRKLESLVNYYPCEITDLFMGTIISTVEYHIKMCGEYTKSYHRLIEKCYLGPVIGYSIILAAIVEHLRTEVRNSIRFKHRDDITGLKDSVLKVFGNCKDSVANFVNSLTDKQWLDLLDDLDTYYRYKEYITHNKKTATELFKFLVNKIDAIKNNIESVLGGIPTGIDTDVDWGVNGMFNGIVYRYDVNDPSKKIRASFKSFIAGGYNIQCRHIRARVTMLKH